MKAHFFSLRFLPLLLALWSAMSSAETLLGRVVDVPDGQTVVVQDFYKQRFTVRIMGIAAPRLDQPFGQEARAELAKRLNQAVEVDWAKVDQYGRLLGSVHTGRLPPEMLRFIDCLNPYQGCREDIAVPLLSEGLTWRDQQFVEELESRFCFGYINAENHARRRRTGMWRDAAEVSQAAWERQYYEECLRKGEDKAALMARSEKEWQTLKRAFNIQD